MPHFLVPSPAPLPLPPSQSPVNQTNGSPGCSSVLSTVCGARVARLRRGKGLRVANGEVEGGQEASLGAQHTAEALLTQKGSEHLEERDERSWGLNPGHVSAPPGPRRATGTMFPHHLRGSRPEKWELETKGQGQPTSWERNSASLGS